MKKSFLAILFLCAPLLFAQDRDIQITIWGSQADMQGDSGLGDGFEIDFEDGKALGASVNVPVNRFLSIEGSVFGIRSDAAIRFEDAALNLGTLDLVPFTLGAQFHPLGNSRFDPYAGAGAAYVVGGDLFSSDLVTLGLGRIELENEVTYYVNAGISVRIVNGLGLTIDGRQIQYEPSSRSTATGVEQDLELSPRLLSVGLRLRF